MQLTMIVTHRVPPTLRRGARITSTGWTTTGERRTQQLSWDHELTVVNNHLWAASRICEALEPAQRAWAPGIERAAVAAVASEELGFTVTEWIVRGALETCGLVLPVAKRHLPAEEKIEKLAQCVGDLCDGLLLYLPLDEPSRRALTGLRDEVKELL